MKAAWKRVEAKRGESAVVVDQDQESETVTSDSGSTGSSGTEQHLEATWDVHIDVDYDGSEKEWQSLRQMFSYANITGVAVSPRPSHDLRGLDFTQE